MGLLLRELSLLVFLFFEMRKLSIAPINFFEFILLTEVIQRSFINLPTGKGSGLTDDRFHSPLRSKSVSMVQCFFEAGTPAKDVLFTKKLPFRHMIAVDFSVFQKCWRRAILFCLKDEVLTARNSFTCNLISESFSVASCQICFYQNLSVGQDPSIVSKTSEKPMFPAYLYISL